MPGIGLSLCKYYFISLSNGLRKQMFCCPGFCRWRHKSPENIWKVLVSHSCWREQDRNVACLARDPLLMSLLFCRWGFFQKTNSKLLILQIYHAYKWKGFLSNERPCGRKQVTGNALKDSHIRWPWLSLNSLQNVMLHSHSKNKGGINNFILYQQLL